MPRHSAGLAPALLTGFALAFARGVGEYGSVIFIAGNLPFVSEIAPLLIVVKLEEFNYAGATAIAVWMLAISFLILLAINLIQAWSRRSSAMSDAIAGARPRLSKSRGFRRKRRAQAGAQSRHRRGPVLAGVLIGVTVVLSGAFPDPSARRRLL